VPLFNSQMNEAIDHGCNWNDCYVPYLELETVLHREVSSAIAIYCFGSQKTHFIAALLSVQLLILLSWDVLGLPT
jgi:hypothetical protein